MKLHLLYPRVVVERLDSINNKSINISSVCNKTSLKNGDNKVFESVPVITKNDYSCCISHDHSSFNELFSGSEVKSNTAGDVTSRSTTNPASEVSTVFVSANESEYYIGDCNFMSVLNDHSYSSTKTSGNMAKFNTNATSRSKNLNENTLNGMREKLTTVRFYRRSQTYKYRKKKRRRKAIIVGDVFDKEPRVEKDLCGKSTDLIDSQSKHLKSGICKITVNSDENPNEEGCDNHVKSCDLPLKQSNCVQHNKRVKNVENAVAKQSVERWPNQLSNKIDLEENSSTNIFSNSDKENTSGVLQFPLHCDVDNKILKEQIVCQIATDCSVNEFTVNNINQNKTFTSDKNNEVTSSLYNISKCNSDFDQILCVITDTFSLLHRPDHELPAGLKENLLKAVNFELNHDDENNYLSNLVKSVCPVECSIVLDRTAVEKWQRRNSGPTTCKRPPDTDILTDYQRTKKLKVFEEVRRDEAEFTPLKNIQNLNQFQRVRKCNDNMLSNASEQNNGMNVTNVSNMTSDSIVKCDNKTAEDRFGTIRIRIQSGTPKSAPAHIGMDGLQDYSKLISGKKSSKSVSVESRSIVSNGNVDHGKNCERPVESVKYKYRYCNCKSWNYSTTERNSKTLYPIVMLSDIKPQVLFLLNFDLQPVYISSRCHIMNNRNRFRSCLFSKRYTE